MSVSRFPTVCSDTSTDVYDAACRAEYGAAEYHSAAYPADSQRALFTLETLLGVSADAVSYVLHNCPVSRCTPRAVDRVLYTMREARRGDEIAQRIVNRAAALGDVRALAEAEGGRHANA